MKRKDLFFQLIALVLLVGCAQGTPTAQTENQTTAPVESPTQLASPTEQPTHTPGPATQSVPPTPFPEPTTQTVPTSLPPEIQVLLPTSEVDEFEAFIKKNGKLIFNDLAREYTVFYAYPDQGIAFLVTPASQIPTVDPQALANDPALLQNQALGLLTVVRQVNDLLPPDHYAITLESNGEVMTFIGARAEASFPATIRALPGPISKDRPVAMISSEQICLAWDTLQICSLVSTPLREDLKAQLDEAIQATGGDPGLFAVDRAVPDTEGRNVLAACEEALQQEPPAYKECKASVLAAPLASAEGLPPPPGEPDATGTGTLVVLVDLEEDVFLDPELTEPIATLSAGNYLMYDIVLPNDPVIAQYDKQQVTESRVGLSTSLGDKPAFYLPANIGYIFMGDALRGEAPDSRSDAVISNLFVRNFSGSWSCYFRWWQCN